MFLDKLYIVPFFVSFFLRCLSCSILRRMAMLWLCYKFILGDKLAYWRACLWAFLDWTVSSVQPNGENRRAYTYLALFILVCAQQTDFDRRKSHGTAGNIGNNLFKKYRYLVGWGSLWAMSTAGWSLCSNRPRPRCMLCPGCWVLTWSPSWQFALKTDCCYRVNNFTVTWTQFFTPEEGVTIFLRNVVIHPYHCAVWQLKRPQSVCYWLFLVVAALCRGAE